ncbi:hypothetical protein [Nocardioides sp. 616]|uniref:hypothetical protein n=1 Tax=Nocardioides sp. 616 TaxID=2268090 RepID=UPI000CE53642|nr:hypothetical protein [Nocardioides sp. 616]
MTLGVVLGIGAVNGCTGNDPDLAPGRGTVGQAPASGAASLVSDSGRTEVAALTAPMRVAQVRWARGNVPRTVPEPDDALPSLLDDPPGRALVASYVPRPSSGFDGEAVEFYGRDGRWRRLDLGDLDLPRDRWSGGDTYGAGALSPDGRWWAGPMHAGMFLVDLRDGSATVRRVAGPYGMASFAWSPDSDELVLLLAGHSTRVSVPDLKTETFPRPGKAYPVTHVYPRLLADGGWVECPYRRAHLVACQTYGPDGALIEERPVPEDLQHKGAGPWGSASADSLDEVEETVFYSLPQGYSGNRSHDWEVLRTDLDFRADARLVLPAGSEINALDSALNRNVLGLAALDRRLQLAWLAEEQVIVKVLRPGVGAGGAGQDFWNIAYARDLVTVR